jgi:hypothetical protein
MQMIQANATSFALSAVGALAILIGVIDQPQVAVGGTGLSVGPLVGAATIPAVSPLA